MHSPSSRREKDSLPPYTLQPIMILLNLCLVAALASTIIATPITPQQYTPANALCTSYNIPLSISTKGLEWNFTKWTDNVGLIDYVSLVSTRPDANRTVVPLRGPVDLNGDYTIAATFCSPKTRAGNGKERNVLLLSHGGGYDSRYWNAAIEPEKYNFVQAAIEKGYSVFLYDRLGWGGSSRCVDFLAFDRKIGRRTNTIITDSPASSTKQLSKRPSSPSSPTRSATANTPEASVRPRKSFTWATRTARQYLTAPSLTPHPSQTA